MNVPFGKNTSSKDSQRPFVLVVMGARNYPCSTPGHSVALQISRGVVLIGQSVLMNTICISPAGSRDLAIANKLYHRSTVLGYLFEIKIR